MGTDLIVPEITLIEKLQEEDSSLAPSVFEQMKNEVVLYDDDDKKLPASSLVKRRLLLSDFVNKAINLPLEITPQISEAATRELYRLHLFCCQQTIHNPEVRRNPLILGFRAIEEMHTALIGIFISYRLIHPECPYSWDEAFFTRAIGLYKGPDGHTIINFNRALTPEIINAAINTDIVTDWLIYRAYDHNGIRTLMDIKNNLIDLPEYKRGGKPSAEFSRFERKMQEHRNKKENRKNEALDLEFRKTLVQNAAQQAVQEILDQGMSAMDLLNEAFNGDLTALTDKLTKKSISPQSQKARIINEDTKEIDNIIAGLLEDDS